MNKNQNIRFNMDKESDIKAWERIKLLEPKANTH